MCVYAPAFTTTPCDFSTPFVQLINQSDPSPLNWAVNKLNAPSLVWPIAAQPVFDLRQRRRSVNVRFADTKQIEVGAVEQSDLHALFSPFSQAENWARSSLAGAGAAGADCGKLVAPTPLFDATAGSGKKRSNE